MPDTDHVQAPATPDLTQCDREPIHILGTVQSFGCLIAVSSDWLVTHVSANSGELIGHAAETLIGTPFANILPNETVHFFRTRLQFLNAGDTSVRIAAYPVFEDERCFDVSISHSDRYLIFEFEPRPTPVENRDLSATVQVLMKRVRNQKTIDRMAAEGVRVLKALCGYDRVMAYRFNADDSGTVIAEELNPGIESYLGLRYPASDIPKQARALYVRNPFRIISDVQAPVHPILPHTDPNGSPLDLSLAVTRSVSPVHLEYLGNMGVAASMSISILRDGKLWGLFACHHSSARHLTQDIRTAAELFAQLFSYELSLVELSSELAESDRGRALHDTLMAQLSQGVTMSDLFEGFSESIKQVIPFDGAVIYADNEFRATGLAPSREAFLKLARFLNTTPPGQVYATHALSERYPDTADLHGDIAGLLALPVSRLPRDYLVLFRREISQTVHWAGNPEKPVESEQGGVRLSPRKSFESWKEIVKGQSAPWRSGELRSADALRATLLEVVLKMSDEQRAQSERAQSQQELLIAELNHRVRNILNLIRGLVLQNKDETDAVNAYRSVLDARISALARAHDQLSLTEWSWISLRTLVQTEIKAFVTGSAARLKLTGDELDLSPTAFTTLALVVHELVTNSAKYGALQAPGGIVSVDVERQPDGRARIHWRESNGPPVQAPSRRGFGTTIIEHSIPYELKGQAELRYRITGVEAEFYLPAQYVRPSAAKESSTDQDDSANSAKADLSGNCLVVEDNLVIALDATDILKDLGADHVSMVSQVSEALDILSKSDISFALLDVNLGEESSLEIAQKCVELGIRTILATGYGSNADIVENYPDLPLIKKPYNFETLQRALSKISHS